MGAESGAPTGLRNQDELQKFKEAPSGETAVRTCDVNLDPDTSDLTTTDSEGNDCVRTCGEFTPAGLRVAGLITIVSLDNSSWTALPATPLTNRNAISIQNQSNSEIKLNYSTPAGYVGVIVPAGGERFYDITDAIVIYGKSKTAGPISVAVEELS